eukprot:TRINITY_DN18_c0_g5_i1.p1 TRINITY_DN18_c0_g5~~TRINITY_DN18_c0_g5_i1.p1  ORF type:complete len:363 (-),score=120.21 TRINITY_DN18_c0_g5_i1:169-1257(-)
MKTTFLFLALALCSVSFASGVEVMSCADCERFAPMLQQLSGDAYPLADGNAGDLNIQLCDRLPSEFKSACEQVSMNHGLHNVPHLSNDVLCSGLQCNQNEEEPVEPLTDDFLQTAAEEDEEDQDAIAHDSEDDDEEDDNQVTDSDATDNDDDDDDDDDNEEEAHSDDDDESENDDELLEDEDEDEEERRRKKRSRSRRSRRKGRKGRKKRRSSSTLQRSPALTSDQHEGLQFLRLQHYLHEVAMLNKMQSPMMKWFPDQNMDSFLGDDGASDDADLGIVDSDGRDDEEDEMTVGSWDDPANTPFTSDGLKDRLQSLDSDGAPNNDASMSGFLRKLKKSIDAGQLNSKKGYRGSSMGMGGPSF